MKKNINVALLDDDCLFVEGLASLIGNNPNFKVVFKASNPIDFIEYLKTTQELPDVALVDLNMKPLTGLEVLDIINQNEIDLRVIVLSSLFNSSMYGYMIRYSISAFLPKYTDKKELFEAIEQVYHHKVFMNEENQLLIKEYYNSKSKSQNPWSNISLSERENEVLTCICKEMSTREIAENLFITVKTVESHRSKIMEKIGCKNVIGMVVFAILNGLFVLTNNNK
ncbi:response regulator transcription factor [Flavobacterium sp. I3-2]|uniref:response regulator transcription factor n=1 Tax=Flavobacterium sp. I3-2 TaxID=2748319 RepID=UPI0015B2CE21|nr:response regulator transcription factor [Flavobacterium sp. I3-2]